MRNDLLKKALEYERILQENGMIKNYPMYLKSLDEYAQNRGFYDFDSMITELNNDRWKSRTMESLSEMGNEMGRITTKTKWKEK